MTDNLHRHADRPSTGRPPTRRTAPGRAPVPLAVRRLRGFAYAFDQLTKLWVTATMTEGERIPGAAAAAALALHPQFRRRVLHRRERHLGVYHHHGGRVPSRSCCSCASSAPLWWALALGLLLGGALGNLTDRLFREPVLRRWAMWWTSSSCPTSRSSTSPTPPSSPRSSSSAADPAGISLDGRHAGRPSAEPASDTDGKPLGGTQRPSASR